MSRERPPKGKSARNTRDGLPTAGAAPLSQIYRAMVLARACDERMWILARQGRARFVVTGRGHEAAQAGSAAAVRAGHDYVLLYYRSLAAALTLGITPAQVMGSVLAREGDPFSGGRQLPNHFSSPALRIPTQSSAVAAGLTHAVGCAYAARVRGEDAVAVCYFGEGATAKGDFHEALNFAAIHHLPVVFFCENNGWAISVPYALEAPVARVAARAAAFALPSRTVDGLDPVACFDAMAEALERARGGGGPTLIEATCVRMVPHSSDDDDSYRDAAEQAHVVAADPLPRFRLSLLSGGCFLDAELVAIEEEVHASVRAAEEQALARATATDAFSHLYASPHHGPKESTQ